MSLPIYLGGESACVPEDVGGPHGYSLVPQIFGDRDNEQHDDMVRWRSTASS